MSAEIMARRTVELYIARLGRDHPDTISAMRLLSRLLHALEKYPESERIIREAFGASRQVFGADHEVTITLKSEADQLKDWITECNDLDDL